MFFGANTFIGMNRMLSVHSVYFHGISRILFYWELNILCIPLLPRENKGTEREIPSVALGICEFQFFFSKLFLDVVQTKVCFPRRPQTYLDA